MSQSTGGIEGFRNKNEEVPYVSDKLQLLKSNSKYKDSSPTKLNAFIDTQEDNSFSNDSNEKFKGPVFIEKKIGN